MTWEWTGEEREGRGGKVVGKGEADPEVEVGVRRARGEEAVQEVEAGTEETRDAVEAEIEMIARGDKKMTSESLRSKRSGRRKVYLQSKKVI